MQKQKSKQAPARGNKAKDRGLAHVDDLLGKTKGKDSKRMIGAAAGETVSPIARAKDDVAAVAVPPNMAMAAGARAAASGRGVAAVLGDSRLGKCLARIEKGEPGPIKLAELTLDAGLVRAAREGGQLEMYRKLLKANPHAQPGRPLVNVRGTSDQDLAFELLSLHELVVAAQELGRETLQVSLVRLDEEEVEELLQRSQVAAAPALDTKVALTPLAIAKVNGFLDLPIRDIKRDENLRQEIDTGAKEFRNLVESIRTIGLQNPPVVEVRAGGELVCVSGHRRLLALEVLEMQNVICALKTFRNERHRMLAGLAENINREDLHFLDKADGYRGLTQQGMTANEIGALLETDPRTVSKYLRAAAWDVTVKQRLRLMGPKATTRFLLNTLAAGERTTEELHALIERFNTGFGTGSAGKKEAPRGAELRTKLTEFYTLAGYSKDQRLAVDKAMKYLGFL